MIQTLGSCTIKGIQCKYHITGNNLYLIPVNENEISVLYQHFYKNDMDFIELPMSFNEGLSDFIYFSQYHTILGGVSLDVEMYYEFYSNIKIKGVVITSDALNYYVNPAEFFYDLKKDDGFIEPELLYNSEGIHDFTFEFEGERINSKIVIGHILQRGIASDLKLNSKLELSFSPTNDREFIYRLQNAVKKCLKFALYKDEIAFNRIELIGNSEKRSICGSIILNDNKNDIRNMGVNHKSNYYWLKDHLEDFFQVVVNDNNLYSAHLKNTHNQYINSNEIRFANIFAAFETEYTKLPKEIRFNDTTSIEPLREKLLEHILKFPVNKNNKDEKVFLDQLISKTKELGKMNGSRKKILIAIEYVQDCIKSSLETLHIDKEKINNYAKRIPEIRNKIVHNNYEGDIGDKIGVSLLEWVTYAMLLKRVGIPSKKVEYILGRVFNSNFEEHKK
ncbi:hypothetical protein ACQKCU_23005 [Heyndrickxia sporothermodurans]